MPSARPTVSKNVFILIVKKTGVNNNALGQTHSSVDSLEICLVYQTDRQHE